MSDKDPEDMLRRELDRERMMECSACQSTRMVAMFERNEWPRGRVDVVCENCGKIIIKGISP